MGELLADLEASFGKYDNVSMYPAFVTGIDGVIPEAERISVLLGLLKEKDMYGYEMIDTLRRKSRNVFELKAGTLYPLLHGMEEKGLLTAYEQEYAGKVRKYYSITKKGKQELAKKTEEWQEYASAVTNVLAFQG